MADVTALNREVAHYDQVKKSHIRITEFFNRIGRKQPVST